MLVADPTLGDGRRRRRAGAGWGAAGRAALPRRARRDRSAGACGYGADRAGRGAARRRGRARGRRRDDGRHDRAAVAAPDDPGRAGRRPGGRPRASSRTPSTSIHLDPAGLAAVTTGVASRDDLAGAVADDADVALRSYDAAVSRTTLGGLAGRSGGLPRGRGRADRDDGPAAQPGDPPGPGRRHLQPGLQRLPPGADGPQRPARWPWRCGSRSAPAATGACRSRTSVSRPSPPVSGRPSPCRRRCASPAGSR